MILAVLRRVFSQPKYAISTVLVMLAALSGALLLPNHVIIKSVFTTDVALFSKLHFVVSLYGTLGSKYTFFGSVSLVLLSFLFGINIALLTYYIRRRQEASGTMHLQLASVGGVVSSLLGIGCAACGSVIVTAVLGLFGASSLLLLLPFHGAEFGFFGFALLCLSIYYIIKRIDDPIICPLGHKDLKSKL